MKLDKNRFYIKKYNKDYRSYLWIIAIIISIGGLYYPIIGYSVPIIMITLLIMSYFNGRIWCGNFCPRGSLNDNLVKKISLNRKIPKIFTSNIFRISFLIFFIAMFTTRISLILVNFSGYNLFIKIGYLFASICFITTIIAISLGIFYSPRTWCSFCPMGTLQNKMYKTKIK